MGETGEQTRDVVIQVLRANKVVVSLKSPPGNEMYTLAKGDRVEAQPIPEKVKRKQLHYLARHFQIPIYLFYHPEMLPAPGATETVQ